MPALYLLIPDEALRGAVTEQLALHGYTDVREANDAGATLADAELTALIIDEAAADKKTLKALDAAAGKKRVFMLGEARGDFAGAVTESFTKPLRLGHLLARLQFYLSAGSRSNSSGFRFGPYMFEPQNRQLLTEDNGSVIRLTEKETALLDYIGQSSAPVGRDELLASIWGYDARIDTHTLETHIYQLRRKLDAGDSGDSWLVNEGGFYRLKKTAENT